MLNCYIVKPGSEWRVICETTNRIKQSLIKVGNGFAIIKFTSHETGFTIDAIICAMVLLHKVDQICVNLREFGV